MMDFRNNNSKARQETPATIQFKRELVIKKDEKKSRKTKTGAKKKKKNKHKSLEFEDKHSYTKAALFFFLFT